MPTPLPPVLADLLRTPSHPAALTERAVRALLALPSGTATDIRAAAVADLAVPLPVARDVAGGSDDAWPWESAVAEAVAGRRDVDSLTSALAVTALRARTESNAEAGQALERLAAHPQTAPVVLDDLADALAAPRFAWSHIRLAAHPRVSPETTLKVLTQLGDRAGPDRSAVDATGMTRSDFRQVITGMSAESAAVCLDHLTRPDLLIDVAETHPQLLTGGRCERLVDVVVAAEARRKPGKTAPVTRAVALLAAHATPATRRRAAQLLTDAKVRPVGRDPQELLAVADEPAPVPDRVLRLRWQSVVVDARTDPVVAAGVAAVLAGFDDAAWRTFCAIEETFVGTVGQLASVCAAITA